MAPSACLNCVMSRSADRCAGSRQVAQTPQSSSTCAVLRPPPGSGRGEAPAQRRESRPASSEGAGSNESVWVSVRTKPNKGQEKHRRHGRLHGSQVLCAAARFPVPFVVSIDECPAKCGIPSAAGQHRPPFLRFAGGEFKLARRERQSTLTANFRRTPACSRVDSSYRSPRRTISVKYPGRRVAAASGARRVCRWLRRRVPPSASLRAAAIWRPC